jgi:hypothetical protein
MTTAFADTQGHALGLHAPAIPASPAAPKLGGAPRMALAVGLFAGLLLLGALFITVGPGAHLRVARASALGQGAVTSAQGIRAFRAGEIGAGQATISSAQGLRAFRAEEIAQGDSTVAPASVAATPFADEGYRDQRLGEIGATSGGAAGRSPVRSHGK